VPLSWNLGTLTSWNLLGHSRPVTGLLYLFTTCIWAFWLGCSTCQERNYCSLMTHSHVFAGKNVYIALWVSCFCCAILLPSVLKHVTWIKSHPYLQQVRKCPHGVKLLARSLCCCPWMQNSHCFNKNYPISPSLSLDLQLIIIQIPQTASLIRDISYTSELDVYNPSCSILNFFFSFSAYLTEKSASQLQISGMVTDYKCA